MRGFLTASARAINHRGISKIFPRTTSPIVRRNMSNSAKTKSESEWRAVLNPEQASKIMATTLAVLTASFTISSLT